MDLRCGEYPLLHLVLAVGALRIVIEIGAATESVNHTNVVGLLSVCMSVAFDVANEEVNRVRLAVEGVAIYENSLNESPKMKRGVGRKWSGTYRS